MHENLPTDPRLELWAGKESGQITCACDETLEWANRAEIGRLQRDMRQCTLPHETKVRREWHSAMRKTLEGCTDNARVVNAAMACWSASDRGVIHTAVEDQAIGWQVPTTRMIGNDCKWEFANGVPPTFDQREHWDEDSDDDDGTDTTDGAADATTDAAELDIGAEMAVRTATGDAAYNVDWNGIGSLHDPTLATLRLLHSARQTIDTSRWWALRWSNNAISLLGTACGLNTEGTCKLFREMRKVMLQHVRELWAVVMDRRDAADNEVKRAALKDEWLKSRAYWRT